MDYTFVYKNGCWWLKINTPKQLFDYWDKTDARWSEAFESLTQSKEFTESGTQHANDLAYCIGTYGNNRSMNPIKATANFRGIVSNSEASPSK